MDKDHGNDEVLTTIIAGDTADSPCNDRIRHPKNIVKLRISLNIAKHLNLHNHSKQKRPRESCNEILLEEYTQISTRISKKSTL